MAVLVDEYRFGHADIMAMPYKTFLAYQRLTVIRHVNKQKRGPDPLSDLKDR